LGSEKCEEALMMKPTFARWFGLSIVVPLFVSAWIGLNNLPDWISMPIALLFVLALIVWMILGLACLFHEVFGRKE
jgi:hypothetical protein